MSRQALRPTYNMGLGLISFLLFVILAVTGVRLMFCYVPSTTRAYDRMLDLRSSVAFFNFGIFLIFLAAVYTCTGKAWIRFHGWVYRAEEPKRYWLGVTTYYLPNVGLIELLLYEVDAFSN